MKYEEVPRYQNQIHESAINNGCVDVALNLQQAQTRTQPYPMFSTQPSLSKLQQKMREKLSSAKFR